MAGPTQLTNMAEDRDGEMHLATDPLALIHENIRLRAIVAELLLKNQSLRWTLEGE